VLSFDQIDALIRDVEDVYGELDEMIVRDIARRISKMDFVTSSAAWQMQRLNQAGLVYDEAIKQISTLTGKSEAYLRKAFADAGVRSVLYDKAIFTPAMHRFTDLNLSPAMLNVLKAGLRKTGDVLRNLTMTTAATAQEAFVSAADMAYMQISSGAFDYGSAIKQAVLNVAEMGLSSIAYPSGHHDQIDVAVRRTVLTGIAQTVGNMEIELAAQMGTDLVQTSAHIGARPTHQVWQGRIFSISGNHPRYPNFYTETGYGTGPGLMGWNCRHSFYPFFEGLSENAYKDLTQYEGKPVTYNGEELSFYEATQVQRGIEREIRKLKRKAGALGAADIDNQEELRDIAKAQAKMRDFLRQTDLDRQRGREQVIGLDIKKVVVLPPPPVVIAPTHASVSVTPTSVVTSADSAEWERKLMFDDFVKETTGNREKGYFESYNVHFADGTRAKLKPSPNPSHGGIGDETISRREAFAYQVSKELELDIVPETVFRESIDASLQRYIENNIVGSRLSGTESRSIDDYSRMSLLDMVLDNTDRHWGNYIVGPDGRTWAIDHGLTFEHGLNIHRGFSGVLHYIPPPFRHLVKQAPAPSGLRVFPNEMLPLDVKFKNILERKLKEGFFETLGKGILTADEQIALQDRVKQIIVSWSTYFY